MNIASIIQSTLRFENMWKFPLLIGGGLYVLPGFFGLYLFDDSNSLEVMEIIVGGLLAYYVCFKYVLSGKVFGRFSNNASRVCFGSNLLLLLLFGGYLIVTLFAIATSPKIAVLEALKGASADEINVARELMFKARTGPEAAIGYMYAFFSSALVPYALIVAYLTKNRFRHAVLVLFILTLLISMEKVLIFKGLLPLMVFFANTRFSGVAARKKLTWMAVLTLVAVIGVTQLSKIADSGDEPTEHVDRYYQLFDQNDSFLFVVNRALWIPYVTAYDWLRFFNGSLHGAYLYGRTSSFVSAVTGQERFNMEQAVFAFQWGQNATDTGTANTSYLIDAYVNFGWFGVMLASFILALMTRLFIASDNAAAKSCYFYFLYQISIGSLIGVLLSNGLVLLLMLLLLTKCPAGKLSQQATGQVKALSPG